MHTNDTPRPRRRGVPRLVPVLVTVVAVLLVVRFGGRMPPRGTQAPGTFSFAVLGDAPYYLHEDLQYRVVRRDLDAHDLAFVIHVGDLFWRPCSDAMYRGRRAWFDRSRHPLVYTPGDNEWTDCWERGTGGYAPRERLARLRQLFFAHPTRSFGRRSLPLVSQGGAAGADSEYVENARWRHAGIVFATVHLVGSDNARERFPGRTAEDDSASARRTRAATRWLTATFAVARQTGARAVVIAFHANPAFEGTPGAPGRDVFEPFLATLEEECAGFGRPVLVVQGDDHVYTVDQPLIRRTTGQPLRNLTRLQVPGSPWVGWVRVTARMTGDPAFTFENRVVPRWQYW
jgi:hypothetical protein